MSILTQVKDSLDNLGFKQMLYIIGYQETEPFDPNTELNDGAFYAGFCLCCCLIETCGHYLTGESGHGTSESSFKAFAGYLHNINRRYDPDILYKALRCGLLHNFTPSENKDGVRNFYELVHNKSELHLTPRSNQAQPSATLTPTGSGTVLPPGSNAILASDGTYLNLQNFVADLQKAMNKFFEDAHSDQTIEAKVEKCASENGYPGCPR